MVAFVQIAIPQPTKASSARSCVNMKAEGPGSTISRRSFASAGVAIALANVFQAVQPTLADGAVSGATKTRARGIYGNRILSLQAYLEELKVAVEQGNWNLAMELTKSDKKKPGVFFSEKNAFVLFASGSFPGERNTLSALEDEASVFFAAAKRLEKSAKDYDKKGATAALKAMETGYDGYLKIAKLSLNDFGDQDSGQLWSTDYDFRRSLNTKQIR